MEFVHHIHDIRSEPSESAARFINESYVIDSTVT